MLMEARSLNWMLGKIYEWANKGVLDQKEISFFFLFFLWSHVGSMTSSGTSTGNSNLSQ